MNTILYQVSELIRSIRRPLVICHISPDGDAVGSAVGLAHALVKAGQNPIVACSDPVPASFEYIPGAESIVSEVDELFDLVISVDSSDLERLGSLPQTLDLGESLLVNIDHHATNLYFGDLNLVDVSASSTAEVVLRLLDHMSIPLDAEIATSLLAGIVTDTRGFRTSNVTVSVMEAALRLMRMGASLPLITRRGLECRSMAAIRLWGAAIDRLQLEDKIIWTSIPLALRQASGYANNGDAGLANFLSTSSEAGIAVVFVEREDGKTDVGLRAVPGFDVSRVALQFGGGGHALAAGCSLPGRLNDAVPRMLAALQADMARR